MTILQPQVANYLGKVNIPREDTNVYQFCPSLVKIRPGPPKPFSFKKLEINRFPNLKLNRFQEEKPLGKRKEF